MYSFMLTSFGQHFDGEICPRYYTKFEFIHSRCCMVFYCVDIPQSTHSTVDGYVGGLLPVGGCNE